MTEQEFTNKIISMFNKYAYAISSSIEEQIHNIAITSLIEYHILMALGENIPDNRLGKDAISRKNVFLNLSKDLLYNDTACRSDYENYNDFLNDFEKYPELLLSDFISIGDNMMFSTETSKALFLKLLVPYYERIFPQELNGSFFDEQFSQERPQCYYSFPYSLEEADLLRRCKILKLEGSFEPHKIYVKKSTERADERFIDSIIKKKIDSQILSEMKDTLLILNGGRNMSEKMYDERGLLKPEYVLTDEEKRARLLNNDGVVSPKDNRTDYGKGIYYLTCDGKECATMEQVMEYNKMYYDRMKNKIDDKLTLNRIDDKLIENRGIHK